MRQGPATFVGSTVGALVGMAVGTAVGSVVGTEVGGTVVATGTVVGVAAGAQAANIEIITSRETRITVDFFIAFSFHRLSFLISFKTISAF
jgi:hypothetical protein